MLLVFLAMLLTGCGVIQPAPECDRADNPAKASLSCEAAVRDALDALSADHPAIKRIQFLYGSASPYDCGGMLVGPADQPVCAYVVFTYLDNARQYVSLSLRNDVLAVASPAPY